eukprot:s448_g23.t1
MRWGTPSRHQIFEARAEPWKCDFTVLGDPAPGDPSKVCECEVEEAQSLAASRTEWVYCASQFMLCDCPGRIRWGIKTKWTTFPKGQALSCTTNKLGDPAPGDAGKHCQCEAGRALSSSVGVGHLKKICKDACRIFAWQVQYKRHIKQTCLEVRAQIS